MDATARHREYSVNFAALTRGVTDWTAPSPVAAWTALDVVRHLIEWPRDFLRGSSTVDLRETPSSGDPVADWDAHWQELDALFRDAPDAPIANPHMGERRLGECLDMIYTTDVFLHSWDLAEASGQTAPMPEEVCESLLAGMLPVDAALRASGQYGPAVPVAADAPASVRLMAFVGRDPNWSA